MALLQRQGVGVAADAFAAVVDAAAAGELGEAADRHRAFGLALGLDLLREGRTVAVDAGRVVAAAVADVLDRAVGIGLAAVVDFARLRGRLAGFGGCADDGR